MEKRRRGNIGEVIAKDFSKQINNMDLLILETLSIPSRVNKKKLTHCFKINNSILNIL